MFLKIEKPPAVEPMTLQQMKDHLRVTIAIDDQLITDYMQAARERIEGMTGRSMVSKGYLQVHDFFPYNIDNLQSSRAYPPEYYSGSQWASTMWNQSQMIKLMRAPLIAVDYIEYLDSGSNTWKQLRPQPHNWTAKTAFDIGDQVTDGTNLQEVTATSNTEDGDASLSGAIAPTWASTLGDTATDGDLTWTCVLLPAPAGDFIYDEVSEPPRLFPLAGQTWPPVAYVPNAVRIHFRAGYGNGSDAPATMRMCMRFLVGNWYENREATSELALKEIPSHLSDLVLNDIVEDFSPTP